VLVFGIFRDAGGSSLQLLIDIRVTKDDSGEGPPRSWGEERIRSRIPRISDFLHRGNDVYLPVPGSADLLGPTGARRATCPRSCRSPWPGPAEPERGRG
jgi:hypothetical protein